MGRLDNHSIDQATKRIILKTKMSNFELLLPCVGMDDVGMSTLNIHYAYTPYPFIAHYISCMFKVDMPTSSIPTQGSSNSEFDISVLTDQRAHMTKDMLNTEKQAKPTYWVRGSDNNFETYSLATS